MLLRTIALCLFLVASASLAHAQPYVGPRLAADAITEPFTFSSEGGNRAPGYGFSLAGEQMWDRFGLGLELSMFEFARAQHAAPAPRRFTQYDLVLRPKLRGAVNRFLRSDFETYFVLPVGVTLSDVETFSRDVRQVDGRLGALIGATYGTLVFVRASRFGIGLEAGYLHRFNTLRVENVAGVRRTVHPNFGQVQVRLSFVVQL